MFTTVTKKFSEKRHEQLPVQVTCFTRYFRGSSEFRVTATKNSINLSFRFAEKNRYCIFVRMSYVRTNVSLYTDGITDR